MNSCVLMATIVRDPELRSTQDGTSVSSMLVEFPSTREEEAPGVVKVEGWGNLAEEMKNSYGVGSSIIIEGRLSMNLLERDGYKEKRATLVASRIYPVGNASSAATPLAINNNKTYEAPAEAPNNVVDFASTLQTKPVATASSSSTPATESTTSASDNNEDWDEIPF